LLAMRLRLSPKLCLPGIGAVVIAALHLGGCAGGAREQAAMSGAWGDTTVVVETALPIVQSAGTAIAGWSAVTIRETVDDGHGVDVVYEPPQLASMGPYTLDSGDKLRIFVYAQPSLSRIYTVDTEGFVSVPLIGNVKARGVTTRHLEGTIRARLGSEFVRDPHVTVDIQQYRPFFILGEVKSAGQYPYVGGLTVSAAAAIAGGYSERANERKVHITRRINGAMERLEVSGDAEVRPGDTIQVKERWF
jgi:polysaccharide biosynthesis/export protein